MTGEGEPYNRDPLVMALRLAEGFRAAAALVASDDEDTRIEAHIARVGDRAWHNADLGARLAVISIASDLRRIADALALGDAEPGWLPDDGEPGGDGG